MLRVRLPFVVCAAILSSAAFGADDAAPAAKPGTVESARVIPPSVCVDPNAADCGALIADAKAERRIRIEALLLRARALVADSQSARALTDYDAVLALDPTMTDVLNVRGELRRATGDRPRALADFTAVLKIRPDHEKARENRKSLSKEIERIGAEMAIGKKPSPPTPAAPLK